MKFVKGYRPFFGAAPETGVSDPTSVHADTTPGADVHGGSASVGNSDSGSGSNNLPPEYQGDPIFLSATATAPLNATASPNGEALRNPYNYAIEVHEIRFLAVTQISLDVFTKGAGQVGVYGGPGAQLGVSMQLGGQQLTRNFIPINLLCSGQQLNAESVQYGSVNRTTANQLVWLAATYRVKLARPMAIMPGEQILVEFEHRGILQNPITGWIGLLGRLTKHQASDYGSRILPFFTAWTPQPMLQPAALPTVAQISSETDLQNTTGVQLEVLRMIGRVNGVGLFGYTSTDLAPVKPNVLTAGNAVGATVATEFTDSPIGSISSGWPQPDALTVQMVKSTGVPVVAPGSPFRCVFDAATRAWELDDVLEPNGYYIARLDLGPPVVEGGVAAANPVYPAIGIYGQREVGL